MPGLMGIVTADADGQHHPDDIEQVAAKLGERPEALVLGARAFDGDDMTLAIEGEDGLYVQHSREPRLSPGNPPRPKQVVIPIHR